MLGGLVITLLIILGAQCLLGIPLLIPVKSVYTPSAWVCQFASRPPGSYITGTVLTCVVILLGTSVWEVLDLNTDNHEADHQMIMMAGLQRTRAQLVVVVCCSIIWTGVVLPRLANRTLEADRLGVSHDALKSQAEQLAAEYNRVTGKGTSSDGKSIGQPTDEDEISHLNQQIKNLLHTQHTLSDEVKVANEAQQRAETSLSAVQTQYKNLETSYDELLERNRRLEIQVSTLGGNDVGDKKSD